MSNTSMVAFVMAMTLLIASFPTAAHNGLSQKQIRALVKKEVAKITRGLSGPAGPAGPQGAPGQSGAPGPAGPIGAAGTQHIRFAHIFSDGTVDTARSRGISQENIALSEIADFEDPDTFYGLFCIEGLPPPLGGQVSSDLDTEGLDARDEQLDLTEDGACVVVEGPPFDGDRGFHVLLLY